MASIVLATILPLVSSAWKHFPFRPSCKSLLMLANPLVMQPLPGSLSRLSCCFVSASYTRICYYYPIVVTGDPLGSRELLKRGIMSLFLCPLNSGYCASRTIEANDFKSVKKMLSTGSPRRGKSGRGRDLFWTTNKLSCPFKTEACIHLWGHTVPLLL